MPSDITLSRIESNIRGYFSGITRESIGVFCSETRDYVVSIVRNIPEHMQKSHLKAAIVLFATNALFIAFVSFAILSPLERRMDASAQDSEQQLWQKNILNIAAVGVGSIAFNMSLTQLHKYKLSRIQLLIIAITAIVYRQMRSTTAPSQGIVSTS